MNNFNNQNKQNANRVSFIDSASLMNVISAFTCHNNIDDWGSWERYSLFNVTESLSFNNFLKIPSGSLLKTVSEEKYSSLYKNYYLALNELNEFVTTPQANAKDFENAVENLKTMVCENPEHFYKLILKTKKDEGFSHWESWTIKHAWVDHSDHSDGLFNYYMIKPLSKILNFDHDNFNLKSIWKMSNRNNLSQVKKWSKGYQHDKKYRVAKDAFMASAILRSYIHESIAMGERRFNIPHPLRQYILPEISKKIYYKVPQVRTELVKIIIKSSMFEKKPKKRIKCWTDNILKLHRGYSNSKDIIDDLSINKNEAEETALKIARELDFITYPSNLVRPLDIAIVIDSFVITQAVEKVIHSPYNKLIQLFFLLGIGYAEYKESLGKKAAKRVFTKKHIRDLDKAQPGRLIRSIKK